MRQGELEDWLVAKEVSMHAKKQMVWAWTKFCGWSAYLLVKPLKHSEINLVVLREVLNISFSLERFFFFLCLFFFFGVYTGGCKLLPTSLQWKYEGGCSSAVCHQSQRGSCGAWTAESYQSCSRCSPTASMLWTLFASLHAETNSAQMQGYLQHRLNLFYKYWQEMACLAAIFSREFWLCSSHPAVADFFAFRSKRWQGWRTCRVVVCVSASLWRWRQSFSFLFLYWRCFFVSCHSPPSPHFQEKGRTYCSTDGSHYGLQSFGSTFCISYRGGERAGLQLEVGCLNCWLTWKPRSLASAFVRSVVWDRG